MARTNLFKGNRLFRHILLVTGIGLILFTSDPAQGEDFSLCDDLTGAAKGLCHAGVAAGCADGIGNLNACASIEETFIDVTGDVAPWVVPCPCWSAEELAGLRYPDNDPFEGCTLHDDISPSVRNVSQ